MRGESPCSRDEINSAISEYPDYFGSAELLEECDPDGSLQKLVKTLKAKDAELKRLKGL
jgi:hypothetical protein